MLEKNIANKRVIVTKAKYYVDDLFNKYYVDNKTVVFDYNKKEIEVANWLAKTFNEKVYMLPRINIPEGIKTADYLFKNEKWDLKEINSNGKRVFDNRINGNKEQSKNYIFDVTNSKLANKEIINQIRHIYSPRDRQWVDKVIVKRNQKIIIIYKRK